MWLGDACTKKNGTALATCIQFNFGKMSRFLNMQLARNIPLCNHGSITHVVLAYFPYNSFLYFIVLSFGEEAVMGVKYTPIAV